MADASDRAVRSQVRVTEQELKDLGAAETPTLLLLNKADRLSPEERETLAGEYPGAILMSALEMRDGEALRERILAFFAKHLVEEKVSIPYNRQRVLAELRDRLQVVREDHGEEVTATVRGTAEVLSQLRARLSGG